MKETTGCSMVMGKVLQSLLRGERSELSDHWP